jgi:hypothetical protein
MIIKDETLVRKTVEIDGLALRYERHTETIRLLSGDTLLFEVDTRLEKELAKAFRALGDIASEAPAKKPAPRTVSKVLSLTPVSDET